VGALKLHCCGFFVPAYNASIRFLPTTLHRGAIRNQNMSNKMDGPTSNLGQCSRMTSPSINHCNHSAARLEMSSSVKEWTRVSLSLCWPGKLCCPIEGGKKGDRSASLNLGRSFLALSMPATGQGLAWVLLQRTSLITARATAIFLARTIPPEARRRVGGGQRGANAMNPRVSEGQPAQYQFSMILPLQRSFGVHPISDCITRTRLLRVREMAG